MRRPSFPVSVAASAALLALAGLTSAPANQGDIQWAGVGPGGGGTWLGVVLNPSDANVVLLGSDVGGVYRTGNGGLSWTNANVGISDAFLKGQAYFAQRFAFNPLNPSIVYLANGQVMKSLDGGNSWLQTPATELFNVG